MIAMGNKTILEENREYWTGRAAGYSEVNRLELATIQRERWRSCLREEIARHFPACRSEELRVLEVGTGPGFFAILLRELGYAVTAIDLTPAMLEEAKKNAGALSGEICFMEMNAEALTFPAQCFDAVISRNLTWNLPHPARAYAEWARVLNPGGLLLNFDANWYAYLFDESAQTAFERDRVGPERRGELRRDGGYRPPRTALRDPPSRLGSGGSGKARAQGRGGRGYLAEALVGGREAELRLHSAVSGQGSESLTVTARL